jgi:hypothetical protein
MKDIAQLALGALMAFKEKYPTSWYEDNQPQTKGAQHVNDHISNDIAKCEGRKSNDPLYPLWHTDCINCIRRMIVMRDRKNQISPWEGHGPCPDKLEMER